MASSVRDRLLIIGRGEGYKTGGGGSQNLPKEAEKGLAMLNGHGDSTSLEVVLRGDIKVHCLQPPYLAASCNQLILEMVNIGVLQLFGCSQQ